MSKKEIARFPITISTDLNEWLDNESKKTGFSKTAIAHMAIERYREQKEGLRMMSNMEKMLELFGGSEKAKELFGDANDVRES